MKNILFGVCVILIAVNVSVAQQKPPAAKLPAAVPAQQVSDDFIIGVDDVLSVSVWKDSDSTVPQAVVRPDGKITLPLIKDVPAAGLTTRQLEESITQKLQQFLTEVPPVSIIVLKIESQKVSIVGQISKPGAYPFGARLTVLELIARAGGLAETARGGGNSIKILRKKDGSLLDFKYKEVIQGVNLKQNVFLENGDIVMVR
jgi:polysaccharide biosynthesis/export protein